VKDAVTYPSPSVPCQSLQLHLFSVGLNVGSKQSDDNELIVSKLVRPPTDCGKISTAQILTISYYLLTNILSLGDECRRAGIHTHRASFS